MKIKEQLNKFADYVNNSFYDILLAIMAALNILPILAPIFAKIGWYWPAKIIYFVYSFFCHQLHWRSLHVCDHQYGWCTRCTGIWLNVLLTCIFVKVFRVKLAKWYWLIILMLPMALDGVIQTVATLMGFSEASEIYYMSNSPMRMFSGSLFGIGFGLLIWGSLAENLNLKAKSKQTKTLSSLQVMLICILISILFYLIACFVWKFTSPVNGPANILDFAAKTPILPQEFLIRGRDTL